MIEAIKQKLDYDKATGVVSWKSGPNKGKEAGTLKNGYRQVRVNGKFFYAHRIAWAIEFGKWPDHQIDHIDGCKTNNKIENLRDVQQEINMQNIKRCNKNNAASKSRGVYFESRTGQYVATIVHFGSRTFLGRFDDAQSATKAYQMAKQQKHKLAVANQKTRSD